MDYINKMMTNMTMKSYADEFKKLAAEHGLAAVEHGVADYRLQMEHKKLRRERYLKYETIRRLESEHCTKNQLAWGEDGTDSLSQEAIDGVENMGDEDVVDLLNKFKKIEKKEICRMHKIFKKIAHGVDKPCSITPDVWITRADLFLNMEMDFKTYCEIKQIYNNWITYLTGAVIQIGRREAALEEEPLLFKPHESTRL